MREVLEELFRHLVPDECHSWNVDLPSLQLTWGEANDCFLFPFKEKNTISIFYPFSYLYDHQGDKPVPLHSNTYLV